MATDHDELLEIFGGAFRHVPLSLYDEDQKPAEQALGGILADNERLREVLADAPPPSRAPGYASWWYGPRSDALADLGDH